MQPRAKSRGAISVQRQISDSTVNYVFALGCRLMMTSRNVTHVRGTVDLHYSASERARDRKQFGITQSSVSQEEMSIEKARA